jgi:transcriptional regulator with XRE-family HTH domain
MAVVHSLTFGQLLARYRIASGLTQKALAARAGVSVRGISDLERGVRRGPYRETLELFVKKANKLRSLRFTKRLEEKGAIQFTMGGSSENGTYAGHTGPDVEAI